MISVESHSKQIKLLNQYIVALEKQVASARKENEQHQKGSSKFAEQLRVMNEDINKLRNQNGQLKFNLARQEDIIRRLAPFEKQFGNVRDQLQKCIQENNRISVQLQQTQESNKANEEKWKNIELELKRKTQMFVQDSYRDKQEIQELKKNVTQREKQKEQLKQLLNTQKKNSQNKISALQGSNYELLKVKNDAITKMNKEVEELKLRYNRDMTSNSQTRNSLGEQIKQLINTSNQSKNEASNTKKQLSQTKQLLDKKSIECDDFMAKLKSKNTDYDILIKKSNEDKVSLLKNIQRLEQEKNRLQSINNACKGDINQNTKTLNDALKKIEDLGNKLFQANQDLSFKKDLIVQNQNEINKLTISLSDTNREIVIKTEEAKVREEYILVLKAEIQKTHNEIEELQQLKSNNLSNIGQLDQKTNKLKGQLSEKLKQIEQKNRIIEEKNAIITIKLSQIHKLEVSIKEHEFNIAKISTDVQNKNEIISRLSTAKNDLQTKLQNSKNENEILDDTIHQLNEHLAQIQNQKAALQKERQDLALRQSEILKEKLGDKDLLTREISSRDKKIQQLTAKCEKMQTLYNQQTKNNTQTIKKLQTEKSNLTASINEAQLQIQSLKKKIQQLQSNLSKTKESFDLTMQQYNAYRKKRETQIEELSNQLKESQKKNEKKTAKLQELNQQIKVLESSYSNQKRNLGDSQKEQIQRQRAKFNKTLLQMKNQHEDAINKKNIQADQLRQMIDKNRLENDQRLKANKDEFLAKEKITNDSIKRLQNEKQVLQNEVKRLNLTTITETQSKTTKQFELDTLRKSMERLEVYLKEQKNTIQQLNKLLESKVKEIQSLESSNAMLRRQVITTLNNEQSSRKQLLQTKSKVNSIVFNSSSRGSLIDYGSKIDQANVRSSVTYKKKKTSFSNREQVDARALSNIRLKEKQKTLGGEKMKSSLVEDLSESNFNAVLNEVVTKD